MPTWHPGDVAPRSLAGLRATAGAVGRRGDRSWPGWGPSSLPAAPAAAVTRAGPGMDDA